MWNGPWTSGKNRTILSLLALLLGREMYVCRPATVMVDPCGVPVCSKFVGLQHASPGGDARTLAMLVGWVQVVEIREGNKYIFLIYYV